MGTTKGTTWGTAMNNNLPQSELLQKSGHTEGTNTKKEEREYIDISLHQKKENTPDGSIKERQAFFALPL